MGKQTASPPMSKRQREWLCPISIRKSEPLLTNYDDTPTRPYADTVLPLPPNIPRTPVRAPVRVVQGRLLIDLSSLQLVLGNRLLDGQFLVLLIFVLAADVDDVLVFVRVGIQHFAISNATFDCVRGHSIKHGLLTGSRGSSTLESGGDKKRFLILCVVACASGQAGQQE